MSWVERQSVTRSALFLFWLRTEGRRDLVRPGRRGPGSLHLLQQDARDATIETMGELVGVSASTVRNRTETMDSAGVIEATTRR
jgi:hypothetical protein